MVPVSVKFATPVMNVINLICPITRVSDKRRQRKKHHYHFVFDKEINNKTQSTHFVSLPFTSKAFQQYFTLLPFCR